MLIEGYNHKTHAHCETGAVLNVLDQKGITLSEPMVFGIGAGISFIYLPFIKINHVPISAFRRLPGRVFSRLCKQLSIEFQLKKYHDPQKAMDQLDWLMDNNTPANVQVGVYHLNYMPPETRMHYNIHTISVVGRENGNYLVSDSVIENIQQVPYDVMRRVRFAPGAFTPHGKMYWITKTPGSIDLRKPIVNGIKESAYEMTGQYFWLIGTRGIRYLAKSMRNWPEKLGEKTARQYLLQQLQMLEIAGTGGSGYRYMYGAFLKEASGILKQDWLAEAGLEMGHIGDHWRKYSHTGAHYLKTGQDVAGSFKTMSDILLEVADQETVLFKKLRKISL